jgi:hypothetical protein
LGPTFEKGLRTLGRRRLPAGVVAILDDPETLRGAIRELYDYALNDRSPTRSRRAIIFRVVSPGERHAYISKLEQFFGAKNLSSQESVYGVPVGYWHIIDDSFVSHVVARHFAEPEPSLLPVGAEDLTLVPELINPRWISEFAFTKKMPRVVYERKYEHSSIVVVQEIQARLGLNVKTIYKKK